MYGAYVATLVFSLTAANVSPDPAVLQARLDAGRLDSGASGVAAAIVDHGEVVWQGQSGTTSIAGSDPLGPGHLFVLGSTTKTYTATMTLKLVEQGLIDLDQTIAPFMPATLPGRDEITVRMLLNHHTGYADVFDDPVLAGKMEDPSYVWNRSELMSAVTAPRYTPGSQFEYSNTNYVLLGEVIERASGKPVEQYLKETICDPLGLENTFLAVDPAVSARLAHPAYITDGGLLDVFDYCDGVPSGLYGPAFMDGGLVSDAPDVGRFFCGLAEGELLGPEMLSEMLAIDPTSNYGLGVMQLEFDGTQWYGHGGAFGGFTANVAYRPDLGQAVVVLANLQDANGQRSPAFSTWVAVAVPEPSGLAVALSGVFALIAMPMARRLGRRFLRS